LAISQKCQYALRAVFELALRQGQGPVRIADVADAQAIPPRFLEVILGQMKQGGFVESRRGAEGGYMLARPPAAITMGDVIRFIDGPIAPVACIRDGDSSNCPLDGECVFYDIWVEVQKVTSEIYDQTTVDDLVTRHKAKAGRFVPNFAI
jgi:Rrf2 family protein